MRCIYEFEFYSSEGSVLAVPFDFGGGTFGDCFEDAVESAADWLIGTVNEYLLSNKQLPKPTFGNQPINNGRIVEIVIDTSLDAIPSMMASEAAEMLGVSRSRVSQLIRSGLLDGFAKGRSTFVTVESVEARLADVPKAGRPISSVKEKVLA